jgi:GMP synthase-like glutamine amidotransferase
MVKIALIDNSIDHDFYNPVIHWKPYIKEKLIIFHAIKGEFPNLNENYTHIILSGSEYTILEKPRWILKEIDFIKKTISKGIPLLGSCFGHQLIAVAISGSKVVRRCKNPEIGWIEVKIHHKNDIFKGIKNKIFTFSSHFDEVFNLPPQFNILASSSACFIQAYQYQNKPIWGIQFHPEINIEQGKELLNKGKIYNKEYAYIFQNALNSTPKDSQITQTIIDNFINY